MKVKTYAVLDNAVELGVMYGWNRAHKYTDNPSEGEIKTQIHQAVMNELSLWFSFDDEDVGTNQ
jgi:hypothetical protein